MPSGDGASGGEVMDGELTPSLCMALTRRWPKPSELKLVQLLGCHQDARGLEPSDGPTTPRLSRRSMSRPARAKPTRSLRWSIEVEPSCDRTTNSSARGRNSSSSSLDSPAGPARRGLLALHTCDVTRAALPAPVGDDGLDLVLTHHGPWIRRGTLEDAVSNRRSPRPTSRSAPGWSRMTRAVGERRDRECEPRGMFALITPVITSTEGRCVAITRWIPTARAI